MRGGHTRRRDDDFGAGLSCFNIHRLPDCPYTTDISFFAIRRVTRRKRETLTRTTFAEWRDESYVNKTHRVVRKAAAFEIWRSVVATTNVVAEVTRVVRAVSLKKNAAGTFAVWRVLAAACSKLLLAATKVSCLRRTKTVLKKWKQQTTERRRDKSWCAFSSVWHGRRAVTKTFQKWDTLAGYLKQVRPKGVSQIQAHCLPPFVTIYRVHYVPYHVPVLATAAYITYALFYLSAGDCLPIHRPIQYTPRLKTDLFVRNRRPDGALPKLGTKSVSKSSPRFSSSGAEKPACYPRVEI